MIFPMMAVPPQLCTTTAHEVRLNSVAEITGSLPLWRQLGEPMSTSSNCPAFLLVENRLVPIPNDMYEYLNLEATRRGVSLTQLYQEEVRAAEELKRLELPREQLKEAAKRDYSNHPWLAGNEEKPF